MHVLYDHLIYFHPCWRRPISQLSNSSGTKCCSRLEFLFFFLNKPTLSKLKRTLSSTIATGLNNLPAIIYTTEQRKAWWEWRVLPGKITMTPGRARTRIRSIQSPAHKSFLWPLHTQPVITKVPLSVTISICSFSRHYESIFFHYANGTERLAHKITFYT